jgi:hypothetical protein
VFQFGSMDFHPGFDEPLLRLRQAAAKAFECVDGEHGRVFLIVRLEMRAMVGLASTYIRMMIPKKPESSGTGLP